MRAVDLLVASALVPLVEGALAKLLSRFAHTGWRKLKGVYTPPALVVNAAKGPAVTELPRMNAGSTVKEEEEADAEAEAEEEGELRDQPSLPEKLEEEDDDDEEEGALDEDAEGALAGAPELVAAVPKATWESCGGQCRRPHGKRCSGTIEE